MTDSLPAEQRINSLAAIAQLLKAAGDELRVEVLRALSKDSFGVLELCQLFDTKQSGMSHHLKVLANAGLVCSRKEGNSIFYRRVSISEDDANSQLKASIYRSIDQQPLSDASREKMQTVYEQRASASLEFFSNKAEQFKEQQDLIAEFNVYGPHVGQVVKSANLSDKKLAMEVGPGNGEFLEVLAKDFDCVIALDNSNQMLQESRKRCEEKNVNNIEFIHSDTAYCREHPGTLDCTVINMVLHHVPSPSQIFEDVALTLKAEGILIVCDLCQHNQDWTREACGDLWLGFDPDDLTRWAHNAGLKEGRSSYSALRNGFQIQIREFIKNSDSPSPNTISS